MNREEYLRELSKYLKKLPKKDYDDTMNYFEEYFDEVGVEGEQDLIRELGSPSAAASEILSKLLNENTSKKESKDKFFHFGENKISRTFLIAILFVLAAPIGIPLTLAAIVITFSFFIVCISLIFTFFALVFVGVLVTIKLFVVGLITIFSSSISGGMILLGSGLIILGITGLLFIAGKSTVNFLINLFKKCISYISRKRGEMYE